MKILLTNDFLFHHRWVTKYPFFELIAAYFPNAQHISESNFPKEIFLKREESKGSIEESFSNQDSLYRLVKFIQSYDLIIGLELSKILTNFLEKDNIKYINIFFHHFKITDDLPLAFSSNCPEIMQRLRQFELKQEKMRLYANYWRSIINAKNPLSKKIANNSAVIIGQMPKDQSVFSGKQYLKLSDFKEEINELKNRYSKLYFLRHPKAKKVSSKVSRKDFNDLNRFLTKNDIEERIENTYQFLADPRIKEVVGLSSSVIFEAEMFGKKGNYLFKPLFDVRKDFVGVEAKDFLNHRFWATILGETKEIIPDFNPQPNQFRKMVEGWWSYKYLDDLANGNFKKPKKWKRWKFKFDVAWRKFIYRNK